MRCRRKEDEVPPMQAEFGPKDWPGRTLLGTCALWKEARRVHLEEHGWPGGPLDMIRGADDVRRRIEGLPLLSWGRTPEELARLNGEDYDPRRRRS